MSALRAVIPRKRKIGSLSHGGDGVSHGHHSGLSAVRIAKPFTHPLRVTTSPEGRRKKRSRFININRSQFPAYEEQAMQEATARKAGEHYSILVSTRVDL